MNKGFWAFVALLTVMSITSHSQGLLNKNISVDVKQQRLDHVLEIISNQGGFYFSYNSNIIKKDSLVSLKASNSLRNVLGLLLPDHYEFRESGNYIIIRKQPIRVTVITNKMVTTDKFYTVSGYVLDDQTANWIQYASVYEKDLLASTLTNANGYFKLKLKQKPRRAVLTVSKEFYQDTSFSIDPGYNQEVSVTLLPISTGSLTIIGPEDYFAPEQLKLRVQKNDSSYMEYTYTKTDSIQVEGTAMGRFLLSTQQKIQSMNLKKFFTTRPFQVSLTPGLGTHGALSPQVINHFSLNVLGGYNGGVNGLEIGGLFNIDKKDVSYVQTAGIFNIVGGKVKGVQVAGVNNTVLDSVVGFQVAGVNNVVKGRMKGFQVSGVYNHVADSVTGMQVAGVGNFSRKKMSGVQVAGVMNFSNRQMSGAQISGLVNYAKHVKGVQIGLINIADTSEGLGIGLINIVLKGYHKLSVFSDEMVNMNLAFKTGSYKLYNILHAGMNLSDSNKAYAFGYGFGSEIKLGRTFTVNPELTAQHLYLGSWDDANIIGKMKINLNVKLAKNVSLFAGPVFNAYYTKQDQHYSGYRQAKTPAGYHVYHLDKNVDAWIGWNAGISFF